MLLLCKRGQNQPSTQSLSHSKGNGGNNFPLFHDILTDVVARLVCNAARVVGSYIVVIMFVKMLGAVIGVFGVRNVGGRFS